MTKQITIYDLLPLLKDGWVAMDDVGIGLTKNQMFMNPLIFGCVTVVRLFMK